ncbi:hypothetical protein M422DRAFT_259186 [Sphaerobolus stellatus SS14]|uniref:Uncharacterized protein n=1 Tax=Sphaerobolus stellatus (strain SS14) TaxID=990650 RepID=A0A0C9UTT6_SPHS4|nr:hypothetical protein M422DRAFT_259186 [Sphaerobolus stellatus SS14]
MSFTVKQPILAIAIIIWFALTTVTSAMPLDKIPRRTPQTDGCGTGGKSCN